MPEEQTPTTGVQDPASQEPAAPAVGAGPWQQDITSAFADPNVAAQVDQFLRSKIQPHMTQLEQRYAQTEQARQLWNAFESDPAAAYAAVTEELYGPDAGRAGLSAIEQAIQGANAQAATPAEPAAPQSPAMDPRVEQMLADYEEQRAQTLYNQAIQERIVNDPNRADINPNLIHAFIGAADPDRQDMDVIDQGVEMYRNYATQFALAHGQQPTDAQIAAGTGQNSPPPVMGSDTTTPASPPTQKQYRGREGLEEALNDFMAMNRGNNNPPPVS